jgi:hypothetical protein
VQRRDGLPAGARGQGFPGDRTPCDDDVGVTPQPARDRRVPRGPTAADRHRRGVAARVPPAAAPAAVQTAAAVTPGTLPSGRPRNAGAPRWSRRTRRAGARGRRVAPARHGAGPGRPADHQGWDQWARSDPQRRLEQSMIRSSENILVRPFNRRGCTACAAAPWPGRFP